MVDDTTLNFNDPNQNPNPYFTPVPIDPAWNASGNAWSLANQAGISSPQLSASGIVPAYVAAAQGAGSSYNPSSMGFFNSVMQGVLQSNPWALSYPNGADGGLVLPQGYKSGGQGGQGWGGQSGGLGGLGGFGNGPSGVMANPNQQQPQQNWGSASPVYRPNQPSQTQNSIWGNNAPGYRPTF